MLYRNLTIKKIIMKTFSDLSDLEKTELSTEQVQYYAKIDCANKGIIIPIKPVLELKKVEEPTQNYFQVGYESFVFEKIEDAQNYIDSKAKAFQIKTIGNNYDSRSQYVSERASDYKEIKTIVLYAKEQSLELKDILEHNATVSKELKAYEESLVEYNKIESAIWEEINEINYRNSRVDFYNKIYNDYLELANNDISIAYNFFEKSYGKIQLNDVDEEIVKGMLIRNKAEQNA